MKPALGAWITLLLMLVICGWIVRIFFFSDKEEAIAYVNPKIEV